MEAKKGSVRALAVKATGVLGEARPYKKLGLPNSEILLASDANVPVSISKSRRKSRKVVRRQKKVSRRDSKAHRQFLQIRAVALRVGLPLD